MTIQSKTHEEIQKTIDLLQTLKQAHYDRRYDDWYHRSSLTSWENSIENHWLPEELAVYDERINALEEIINLPQLTVINLKE